MCTTNLLEYNFIVFGNWSESSSCVSDHFIINICNFNVLIDIVVVYFVVFWLILLQDILHSKRERKIPFQHRNTIIHVGPNCENKVWTTFIHDCNYQVSRSLDFGAWIKWWRCWKWQRSVGDHIGRFEGIGRC